MAVNELSVGQVSKLPEVHWLPFLQVENLLHVERKAVGQAVPDAMRIDWLTKPDLLSHVVRHSLTDIFCRLKTCPTLKKEARLFRKAGLLDTTVHSVQL
ncbi:MAG: hypothetical protein IH991_13325 [Planctomycetes bacterium]|nr:hypothetical protein [Planctomycetota bacterium]